MIGEITEQIRACVNDGARVILDAPDAKELLTFLVNAQAPPVIANDVVAEPSAETRKGEDK